MKEFLQKGKKFFQNLEQAIEDVKSDEPESIARTELGRELYNQLSRLAEEDEQLSAHLLSSKYYPRPAICPIGQLFHSKISSAVPGLAESQDELLIQNMAASVKVMHELATSLGQSYQQPSRPQIVCVALVQFHHKRGVQIGYFHPASERQGRLELTICNHAMPDSCHNRETDFNYFNFERDDEMLFGVSYYWHRKVTEDMALRDAQLTRGYKQQAIVIVSRLPIFCYLQLKAESLAALFIEQQNYKLFEQCFSSLNEGLSDESRRLDSQEFYLGVNYDQLGQLGWKNVAIVIKALIAGSRVIVFAKSPSLVSRFLLSLLSLFPGQLLFGTKLQSLIPGIYELQEYGLPLRLFSRQNPLFFSFGVEDLDTFKPTRGYLLGTTNPLVVQTPALVAELTIDLQKQTLISAFELRVPRELAQVAALAKDCPQAQVTRRVQQVLRDIVARIIEAKHLFLDYMQQCKEYSSSKKSIKAREPHINNLIDMAKLPAPRPAPELLDLPLADLLEGDTLQVAMAYHNPAVRLKRRNHGQLGVFLEDRMIVLSRPKDGLVWSRPYVAVQLGPPHNLSIQLDVV